MITRPLFFVLLCFGFFILIQSLVPKVMAMKKSKVDEYMQEDQRTRKRKNYVVRFSRENDILGNAGNIGTNYETDSIQPETSDPEELSAFIVDYANMMRNDVILLDNSVETRTRKRGNIKVEKYNQALPDRPCSCEFDIVRKDLGENSYPRYVETRNCKPSQETCLHPYICGENMYNITILRKRERGMPKQESLELPIGLTYQWVAVQHSISVGCECIKDYYIQN